MALQMSPDNLPGYLPPGTAPFCKCWKETLQVPSWHLCDWGLGAVVMLLCPPPVSPCAPVWGTRNCQGGQDFSILTWITLKIQMSICLWLVSSSEVSPDTRFGGTEHLGKEKTFAECIPNLLCLEGRKSMAWCTRELPCLLRAEVRHERLRSNRFSSLWQLRFFNLNKGETKQQKPSPVSIQ